MNSTSLDLSNKVDPKGVEAVAAVSGAVRRIGIPFLIVGAVSRDFLLEFACGVKAGRDTLDVDFAVRVNSWEGYEKLVKELEESEMFVRDRKRRHRFRAPNSLIIDLVPFGPIAASLTVKPDNRRLPHPPPHILLLR